MVSALAGWWAVSLVVSGFFWWRFSIWPLVFGFILIDGYYGGFFSIPLLSLAVLVLAGLEVVFKPWLLLYNDQHALVQKDQSQVS